MPMGLGLGIKLTSSQGGGGFSPKSIAGLELWLDAKNAASLSLSSALVSSWADLSGHTGRNMAQAVSADQSTYLATGFNGKPTVSFTGSPVFMEASVPAETFSAGLTWFMVFQKFGASSTVEAVITRTVPTHTMAPIDEYQTTRLSYGGNFTSFDISTQTTPTIYVKKANVARDWYEEFVNQLSKFNLSGQRANTSGGVLVNDDTSGVITLATRDDRFTSGRYNLSELLCYSGELSFSDVVTVQNYLATKWGINLAPPANSIRIVAHGDSITKATNYTDITVPWLNSMVSNIILSAPGVVYAENCGIDGQSWNYVWPSSGVPYDLIDDAPKNVDPLKISGISNYLVAWAGTNGLVLGGNTAAQEYAAFQTYIQARIAAGWDPTKIAVVTMLPRQTFSETIRSDYNALLVAGASTYGYKLARVDLDATIGVAGSQNNTTNYEADAIHLRNTGHAIAYPLIKTALGL